MKEYRALYKSISYSKKWARVSREGGELADLSQVLWMLMMVHADDYGRIPADPETVKMQCHPSTSHGPEDVERALQILNNAGLITLYEVAGRRYLEIENFLEYQRLRYQSKSRIPSKAGSNPVLPTIKPTRIPDDVFESDEIVVSAKPKSRSKPKSENADDRRENLKTFISAAFKETKGHDLITNGGDWKAFEDLLKRTRGKEEFSLGRLKNYWMNFLISKDPFHQKQGRPLAFWCSQINAFTKPNGNGYKPDTVGMPDPDLESEEAIMPRIVQVAG